jgi:pyruvate dehydrogenase (quinone)
VARNASDILIDTLEDWGVDTIFGLPGDGINGIMEALRQRRERIRFVHVRHEESAAFMACAYAKYTGRLGVCLATSGPGGIHLLNGLYDAKLDGQPVLAITGQTFHDLIGTRQQQDIDLERVFTDVSVFSERIMGAAHVENVTNLAIRSALARRGVAHLNFPVDLQEQKGGERSKRNVKGHVSEARGRALRMPAESEVRRAAEVLNGCEKTVILAGQGALDAGHELLSAAHKLQAPIVKALLGKAAVPDDSPYTTGGIGLLGTRPSQEAIEDCDSLLLVGTSFPYMEFYPKPGDARAVQIDLDATRIGIRYPVEVGLVGDSRETLRMLLPLLRERRDGAFLKKAQKGMREWIEAMEKQASRSEKPMKPQVVAWELGKRLREDAIVSCDSGTNTSWFARFIPARKGQKYSVSGNLASMACGLPYTIAAQVAFPDRQCIGFVGDGGFAMLMGEFATAVQHRLPIKIVVVKNNTLGQIKWEQMVFLGNPEYGCDLQPIDFAMYAIAAGAAGFTITDPADCGRVIEEALGTPGPVVVQGVVDPFEPPLPGKVTIDQAAKFAQSLVRGEPNREKIAWTVLADRVREMV